MQTENGDHLFDYQFKTVPFEICWLKWQDSAFTLRLNSLFTTTQQEVGKCLQTGWCCVKIMGDCSGPLMTEASLRTV